MEEERLRYKLVLPQNDFFLSNISYYANRISSMEKTGANNKIKNNNNNKVMLLPNSYKVYDSLQAIK